MGKSKKKNNCGSDNCNNNLDASAELSFTNDLNNDKKNNNKKK